ncbi:hypothetical protein DHEL01_v202643 [Diaporthe helianthi]|uniref:Uncharacterized protein n=1 Tax=Diaporthe helianthi TaxID=158607 RepID=A0A2P5I8Y3_DIAHE|nr:hypothetical protein DHEL01_v202643 [Diaporthe helianthi]
MSIQPAVVRSTVPFTKSPANQLTRHDFTAQPVDKPQSNALLHIPCPVSSALSSAINRQTVMTFPLLQGWSIPAGTLAHVMTPAPCSDLD